MTSKYKYGLSIGYWNVDGIQPKHIDKTQDQDFINFVKGHDIIGLGETHLNDNSNLCIEGYKVFSIIRPKTKKSKRFFGGISIIVKNSLKQNVSIVRNTSESNYLWAKIDKEKIARQKIYIYV